MGKRIWKFWKRKKSATTIDDKSENSTSNNRQDSQQPLVSATNDNTQAVQKNNKGMIMKHQSDTHVVSNGGAATSNGSALYVEGNVGGSCIGGDYNDYRTFQVPSENFSKTIIIEMIEDLAKKLNEKLPVPKKSSENNPLGNLKLQCFKEARHWNYCKSEKDVKRKEISKEIRCAQENDIDMETVLKSNNKNIVIIGPAKSGKFTLIQKRLETFRNNFKYVVYINFDSYDGEEETDCLHFWFSNSTHCEWMNDKVAREKVLNYITGNEQEKILFIFNHLEKLNLSKDGFSNVGYYDESTSRNFVINIVQGFIFRKSKKIFISRPHNLVWVHEWNEFQPEILYLSCSNQEYFENYLRTNHPDKVDTVLDVSPICKDICSFCFVPQIPKYLSHELKNYSTTTLVFASTYLRFIRYLTNGAYNLYDVIKLGHFTWSNFHCQKKFCVTLKPTDCDCKLMELFFITLPIIDFEIIIEYKSHMQHILVQEFVIALQAVFMPIDEFKNVFDDLINDDNMNVITKFTFGLCNSEFVNVIEIIFNETLKPNLKENLLANTNYIISEVVSNVKRLLQENNQNNELLLYCDYLYELQNDETACRVAQLLKDCSLENNKATSYVSNLQNQQNTENTSSLG